MLGIEALSAADRRLVLRARRLQRYLTQPFHVLRTSSGIEGASVPLARTLDDCEALLAGKYDDAAEEQLYMRGALSEAAA